MIAGGKWRGADGTIYAVVAPNVVKQDQPRWWVDEPPESRDKMLGPSSPERLHLLSAAQCGGEIRFALVTQ